MRIQLIVLFVVLGVIAPLAAAGARDVQITFVFSRDKTMFVRNLGSESVSLDGWRFSTSNSSIADQQTDADALNGVTLGVHDVLQISFDNDAANASDPLIFNAEDLGDFAPHEIEAYAISLYFPDANGIVDFNDGTQIADHLQWSVRGVDNGVADARSDEAESGGVWTDQSAWIDMRYHAYAVEYIRFGEVVALNSPEDFNVIVIPCPMDINDDGVLDIFDVILYIERFNAGDPAADLNFDGVLDIFDAIRFLGQFQQGCLF